MQGVKARKHKFINDNRECEMAFEHYQAMKAFTNDPGSKVTVVLTKHALGTVKCYNAKNVYGLTNYDGTHEDVFVHKTAITFNMAVDDLGDLIASAPASRTFFHFSRNSAAWID